jgi:hypothetical protein
MSNLESSLPKIMAFIGLMLILIQSARAAWF